MERTKKSEISSLSLKPTPNLELLLNQFNNATPENNNDLEIFFPLNIMIMMKCIMLKYLTKINLSLFHINAYSLDKNFDDLQCLLSCTKSNFGIIGVT